MKPITININDEYKIKIENGNEFKNSIFEEVYSNATKSLCNIIFQSRNSDEYDSYNNIIAFTGERGKGKSSSMISFRNAILNYDDHAKHASYFKNSEFEIIHKHNFAEIDIIDPSLFRGNESLFEIVVAKMFSKFQSLLKDKNNKISDEQRRETIKLFQQVFDNMKIINSDKKDIYNLDSLEALSNLAYSSNLRECFGKLVDNYLKLVDSNKGFLIISIDDFDLNIAKAYEMLEDIRHFLIQKKIILLVACKIEQLKDSIVNEIVKEYRHKLNLEQKNKIHNIAHIDEKKYSRYDNSKFSSEIEITNEFIISDLSKKAEKYIEKLIPFNQQIFIPSLTEFCDITFSSQQEENVEEFIFFETSNVIENIREYRMSIIYTGDSESLNNISLDDLLDQKNEHLKDILISEEKIFIEKNIYDCLLKLIYIKSKIFINKTDYRYHSIFPATLRELNELIKVFNNENVLESFRKYILYKSINELPENLKNIIVEIDNQDFSFLNSHIINQLGNIRDSFEKTNNSFLDKDFKFNSHNPSLTTIGEVFSKLRILNLHVKSTNVYWYKFLDYLGLYYSIRINQVLRDKPKLLLEYCKGGLYDGEDYILPRIVRQKDGRSLRFQRDWIEYNITDKKPGQTINAIFNSLEETDAYWLAFFVQYFGKVDTNENNYPYFRKINQGGGRIYNLTFSPISIFTNILFPIDVWYSIFNKDYNPENIIVKDILKWKEENIGIQKLLLNPMFFNELMEIFSIFSAVAFKSSLVPNYYETLYAYFDDSLKKAFSFLNEKYSYLCINETCFDYHPIKLHWERINEDENSKQAISLIFEALIKEEYPIEENTIKEKGVDIEFLKNRFNYYKSYLLDESNTNSQSLTYLLNSFDKTSTIYADLSKIRYTKTKTILEKKKETFDYFTRIINGQSS